MFEMIFLGTSASAPSIHRGLSSQVIKHEDQRFLIDCGEGTQRQILKSGIGFKKLNKVLITHGHLDHILGLGGLLSTFMRWETIEEMEIYAGKHALARIKDLLFGVVLRGVRPPMELVFHEVEPGLIFETEDFTVKAVQVSHRGPDCYGYVFEERSRRPFLPEKAEELNIPQGPWRRDLVLGQEVTLPDGRVIHPEQVLGPVQPGTRYAHIGDAGKTENLLEHLRGVDALTIEATYLNAETEMADRYGHLTAQQAAEFAIEAEIGHLILTHISRRYRERDVVAEAREVYPNSFVARDFDTYQIRRGNTILVEE